MPDEHGKPAQDGPLQFGEKAVTPIHRGVQSPLARRGASWPKPGKRKPLIQ